MSLIKNSSWNIVGYAIPAIFAIPALGFIARKLGIELFGLFTLALSIVGYASIFDAGLTRAVTREIALNRSDFEEKKRIVSTSTCCIVTLGIFGSVVIILMSHFSKEIFNPSIKIEGQIENGIAILSLAIPMFLLNQLWLAILEGEEKFKISNCQKIISNTFVAIFPAFFVNIENSFTFAIVGLVFSRFVGVLLSGIFNRKIIYDSGLYFDFNVFKRLIKFGGWITVSNIISPLMTLADRFIISSVMGASKLSFYSGPAEAVSRLTIIPAAISRAIFPKLSGAVENSVKRKVYKRHGYIILALICTPIVIIGLVFSGDILSMWLGSDFSNGSSIYIFRLLLIGFLFNALAQIPYSSIQAMGFSKKTALIHIFEALFYFVFIYYAILFYGVIGAAFAWTLRVIIDFIILIVIDKSID